nr:aldehyde dehydrogenase family 2 member C4-like [Ipomoea trifida]
MTRISGQMQERGRGDREGEFVKVWISSRDHDEQLELTLPTRTVSRSVKSGVIWINCYFAFDSDAPFGGYKMSGFDREMGMESLSKYLQVKTIATPVYNSPWL